MMIFTTGDSASEDINFAEAFWKAVPITGNSWPLMELFYFWESILIIQHVNNLLAQKVFITVIYNSKTLGNPK